MQQQDLSHIAKQIQKFTAEIDSDRRHAEARRLNATQKRQNGDPTGAEYDEHEAQRFDQHANEKENEIDKLTNEKEVVEQRIKDLEEQRTQVDPEHADRLAIIDKELAQLRGSAFML